MFANLYRHRLMTDKHSTISSLQGYMQPLSNAVRNPRNIANIVPTGSGQEVMQQARNTNREHLSNYAIILAQVLGFFTVGEMIGRLKLVGYHGDVHHEH